MPVKRVSACCLEELYRNWYNCVIRNLVQGNGRMKPVFWVGSSRQDLRGCPEDVQRLVGYALFFAQEGDKHPRAKPLHGFHGASVLEVVDDYDGDTYRAVYTVRFAEAVYVLHVFQKKSSHGTDTSRHDIELIERRLRSAQEHYAELAERRRME